MDDTESQLHLRRNASKKKESSVSRKKSLVRPERSKSFRRAISGVDQELLGRSLSTRSVARADTLRRRALAGKDEKQDHRIKITWWVRLSRILTFYAPPFVLSSCCGKKDKIIQQAFREKLALCTIILIIMTIVAFLTFGFQETICAIPAYRYKYTELGQLPNGAFSIHGKVYNMTRKDNGQTFVHPGNTPVNPTGQNRDYSFLFPPGAGSACSKFFDLSRNNVSLVRCAVEGIPANSACHNSDAAKSALNNLYVMGEIILTWDQIKNDNLPRKKLVVYNGLVLDVTRFDDVPNNMFGNEVKQLVNNNIKGDMTLGAVSQGLTDKANCLAEIFTIAILDIKTTGCFIADIVLYICLVFIGGVVGIRFILAIFFALGVGWRLGDTDDEILETIKGKKSTKLGKTISASEKQKKMRSRFTPVLPGENLSTSSRMSMVSSRQSMVGDFKKISHRVSSFDISYMDLSDKASASSGDSDGLMSDPNLMHTLVMVPCYSEGYDSLKATLDSIVNTDYPTTHKCIFVVADGIVQGAGNEKPSHEFLIDMMDIDPRFKHEDPSWGGEPEAYSYVAIADGNRRRNFARVYAGWYKITQDPDAKSTSSSTSSKNLNNSESDSESVNGDGDITGRKHTIKQRIYGKVPMILVVKVGNEEERASGKKKSGNRGKRDSQVVLMNFLSKVLFDDRMTELEFDIFYKLFTITGINPEKYESVMMVDADTKIEKTSLRHMIAAMVKDPNVIGLCGETKVENKWGSWVTMIQVFEYFISHHLSKAFESIFGVVTCLPGCFSIYRIRVPKGEGYFVPVLANPDIVEEYSENVVDTLHKKNLLLLGEDRYLSTLMLKSFPKRKMIFVPKAVCQTVIPDEFSVLLSQRRRWINSTIHNLLELLKVRDLCGIFCFSMQFIVFMELIGTVVLPAAICFTIYVLASSVSAPNPPIETLILLGAILGLPGLLTIFLSGRIIYLFWMIVYLLALPIWNFVLPLYAFWHFDDFSWGETRKTDSDKKGEDHGRREGEFDGSGISMKRWSEWMAERRMKIEQGGNGGRYVKPQRMPTHHHLSIPGAINGPHVSPMPSNVSSVRNSMMPPHLMGGRGSIIPAPISAPGGSMVVPNAFMEAQHLRMTMNNSPASSLGSLNVTSGPRMISFASLPPMPMHNTNNGSVITEDTSIRTHSPYNNGNGHVHSIHGQRSMPNISATPPQPPSSVGMPPMMIRAQMTQGQHIVPTSVLHRSDMDERNNGI